MKKKYKAPVTIVATAEKYIGEIEFDSVAEYMKKSEELWESQENEHPSNNISNNFDLNDWSIEQINEADLSEYISKWVKS